MRGEVSLWYYYIMTNKEFAEEMKTRLMQEEASLELELTDIGKLHNVASGDWAGDAGNLETGTEDENVLADKMEEVLTNDAIVSELEARLANVKKALQKMEEGTYGTCENCDKPIGKDRLEANPAATTCIDCE